MTCFYSYQELLVAAHQPQTVEKDGEYAVWVWAQGGASARVSINDTWFKQTHDSKEWKLTWQEAGRIDLKAGQACRIQIQTGQILGGSEHGPRVGGLALTTDKGFDPNRNDEVSRVFNQSAEAVADQRLLETKGVHTPMTLRSYTDLATWEKRAAQIRQHILVCLGLWPLPQRKALKAKIFGRIVRDGYSVEKVFFESWPGF